MRFSGEKPKKRSVFDVQATGEGNTSQRHFLKNFFYGRNVLNLRPKLQNPWLWSLGIVLVALLVFFGVSKFFTHAEVNDFYPTTCLGTWQNPANAAGQPETLTEGSSSFSAENSAVYNASGTQIFCGGFVPQGYATSGVITNVGLTLVWQVGESTSTTNAGAVSDTDANTSSSVLVAPQSTTTMSDASSASAAISSPTSTFSTDDSVATTSTVSNASNSSTPAVQPVSPAPSVSPTPSDDTSSVSSSGTSFVRDLIPFAFADDDNSDGGSTTVSSSVIVLGPPLIASIAPVSSSPSSTTSASVAVSSSSPLGTTTDETDSASSVIPVAPLPTPLPAPDENFLDVSYTTDGQTWISLGQVSIDNWQQFTVTIPVTDWQDLQNLQVRIEGIPTTQDPVPPVYLDGMFMEVHYDVPSAITPTDISTSTAVSATSSRITLYNPGAEQSCQVQPFSQVLPRGGTAEFTIVLHPSINGISYDLETGHLPSGVGAFMGDPVGEVAATSSLDFEASTDAEPGSMNIAVVYQEQEENGSTLTNFCQANIVVE